MVSLEQVINRIQALRREYAEGAAATYQPTQAAYHAGMVHGRDSGFALVQQAIEELLNQEDEGNAE